MKRFLRRLFGPPRSSKAVEANRYLAKVEARLEEVSTGNPEEALLLNRAADLALTAGDRERALQYYGRCIDAHMKLRQFDAANGVCRKLLRLVPDVVRARCTLAWLTLGKGQLNHARRLIGEYVEASVRVERQLLAVQQIRLMARYTSDADFRTFLAENLESLGDEEGARAIGDASAPAGVPVGWDPVVFAAMLTPGELREARDRGLDLAPGEVEEDELPLYWPEDEK